MDAWKDRQSPYDEAGESYRVSLACVKLEVLAAPLPRARGVA